jgi:hypothetical protein
MKQDFYSRVIAEALVAVANGACTVFASSGLASTCNYTGVGLYELRLRAPGLNYGLVGAVTPKPLALITPAGTTVAFARLQSFSPDLLGMTIAMNDAAGAPVDSNFFIHVRTVQRFGGDL